MTSLELGLAELQRKLNAMDRAVAGRIRLEAVTQAAEPIAETAKALAPKRTGRMADSIGINTALVESVALASIGPSNKYFYARFIELGTAHMTARPFLKPALDSNRDKSIEIMADIIRKGISETLG